MEGYKPMFEDKIVTVWSAPNYCYRCGNVAAILELDDYLNKQYKLFEAAPQVGIKVKSGILALIANKRFFYSKIFVVRLKRRLYLIISFKNYYYFNCHVFYIKFSFSFITKYCYRILLTIDILFAFSSPIQPYRCFVRYNIFQLI